MSEVRSNSSYALSAVQFNSKSLNPLDSIHPSVINKIKRQADAYLACSNKCAKIWEALAKNDIAGSHMTQNVMEVIFKQFKNDLSTLTKVSSLQQFMKIFDQDKDGCLNADEQIQIFAFIKERLQLVANNCLQVQEYIRFQNLMKEVRILQYQIAKWQAKLREKIHMGQIQQYRKQGESKIDQFCDKFDKEYENLQKTKIERRQTFQKQAFYEAQALQQRLNQPSEYLKIKPKNRLKQLQFQEKLVSLEERVYEAIDFRRELNELQIKQKDRVDKLMHEHANQQRQNLRIKHQKQRKQLEQKLQELENKLIIKMKRQFDVLRKKNNLHELQIRKLQGFEKKWADKKGLFEPELKRTKKLERQRNQVLSEYKKAVQGTSKPNDDTLQDGKKPTVNKFNARSILNNTTKFKLTNKSESDIPVNKKLMKIDGNMGSKIHKYIVPKSTEKTFSICKLYNSNLEEEEEKPVINQSLVEQEKYRKYNFMVSKLF